MSTKIVEIKHCNECPHCTFDMDSGVPEFWGKHYCNKLERVVDPDNPIPDDCPLQDAEDYCQYI